MRIPNNLEAIKTKLPGVPAGLLEEVRAETPRQAQMLRKLAFRCAEQVAESYTADSMQAFLTMTALHPEGDVPEKLLESVRKPLQKEGLARLDDALKASREAANCKADGGDHAMLVMENAYRSQLTMHAVNAVLAACHPDACQAAQEAGFWAMLCFPALRKGIKNADSE